MEQESINFDLDQYFDAGKKAYQSLIPLLIVNLRFCCIVSQSIDQTVEDTMKKLKPELHQVISFDRL